MKAPTPLRKGDMVHIVGQAKNIGEGGVEFDESEVERAGAAGFRCKAHPRVYFWHDRGATWTSAKLDRQDATRGQFSRAARGGGKATK